MDYSTDTAVRRATVPGGIEDVSGCIQKQL
jgi:hypothetical protein